MILINKRGCLDGRHNKRGHLCRRIFPSFSSPVLPRHPVPNYHPTAQGGAGREYFSCPKAAVADECDFFVWVAGDSGAEGGDSGASSGDSGAEGGGSGDAAAAGAAGAAETIGGASGGASDDEGSDDDNSSAAGDEGTPSPPPRKFEPIPDGWFHVYALLAAIWSSWSGISPTEWNRLMASEGAIIKSSKEDQLATGPSNPCSSPAAMSAAARTMVNNNGQSVSRRETEKAIKEEKAQARQRARDKITEERAKETADSRRQGVAAMVASNKTSEEMVGQIKRLATIEEEREVVAKRARKIAALEKRNMLAGGKNPIIVAQLDALLAEEIES